MQAQITQRQTQVKSKEKCFGKNSNQRVSSVCSDFCPRRQRGDEEPRGRLNEKGDGAFAGESRRAGISSLGAEPEQRGGSAGNAGEAGDWSQEF